MTNWLKFLHTQHAEIEKIEDVNIAIDKYISIMRPLIDKSNSYGMAIDNGTELYRSTSHHKSFPSSIKDISYPPIDSAILNRANRPKSPKFYCSSDPGTTLLELKLNTEFYCILAKWRVKSRMIVHKIGYLENVFIRLGSTRVLDNNSLKFEIENTSELRTFMHESFTEYSHPNYKITTAVAEVLLNADFFSGLMYPSISKQANTDNLALFPESVDKHLILVEAQCIRVTNIEGTNVLGKVVAISKEVTKDGNFIWKLSGDLKDGTFKDGETKKLKNNISRIGTRCVLSVNGIEINMEPGYMMDISSGVLIIRDLKGKILGKFFSSNCKEVVFLPPKES